MISPGAAGRARRHPRALLAGTVVLAAIGIAVLWHATERPPYRVDATITLTGGSCVSHRAVCSMPADSGTVAVYGGGHERGHAGLRGPVTRVHFSLERGAYLLAFRMTRYSVLVTDLVRAGDGEVGGFRVSRRPLDLGVVRPSAGFIYEGD